MSKLPIPHIINTIKTKLGFDRTMTAPGEDVVDAVNKQSQQIGNLANLETKTKTDLVSAINYINPTRTMIRGVATIEDDLLALPPGCYNTTAGKDFGLPTRYGSLLVAKGEYSYGLMLFADSDNNLYYRNYYYRSTSDKGWRGEWISLTATATGTIVKASNVENTGTLDYTVCTRKGNVVTVAGRIYGMTNVVATGAFFQIPEGFRPHVDIYAICYIVFQGNNNFQGYICRIKTDGTVTMSYDLSSIITQIGFSATYCI